MGCGWEPKYKPTKWDRMADAQRIARNKEAYALSELFRNNSTSRDPAVLLGTVVIAAATLGGYWLWKKLRN